MKLSNFRDYRRTGSSPSDFRFYATVDVTTGRWFKNTTVARRIARTFTGFWFFADNGQITPMFDAECMERAANAQRGLRGEPVLA